jgi:GNAT superfamily N-acetyltransferase
MAIVYVHMLAKYHRVSRLVVLPDYQGVGIGKRSLQFMAEYYTSRTGLPFDIITSNPQLVRGTLPDGWKIRRIGRTKQVDDRNLSNEYSSSSKNRLTISLRYWPKKKK